MGKKLTGEQRQAIESVLRFLGQVNEKQHGAVKAAMDRVNELEEAISKFIANHNRDGLIATAFGVACDGAGPELTVVKPTGAVGLTNQEIMDHPGLVWPGGVLSHHLSDQFKPAEHSHSVDNPVQPACVAGEGLDTIVYRTDIDANFNLSYRRCEDALMAAVVGYQGAGDCSLDKLHAPLVGDLSCGVPPGTDEVQPCFVLIEVVKEKYVRHFHVIRASAKSEQASTDDDFLLVGGSTIGLRSDVGRLAMDRLKLLPPRPDGKPIILTSFRIDRTKEGWVNFIGVTNSYTDRPMKLGEQLEGNEIVVEY